MEQKSQLEKIQDEKLRLSDAIRPAIEWFVKETGAMPSITVGETECKTKCGTWKDDVHIMVNAIL